MGGRGKSKALVAVTEIRHGRELSDGNIEQIVYSPDELIVLDDFTPAQLESLKEAGAVELRDVPVPPEPPSEEKRTVAAPKPPPEPREEPAPPKPASKTAAAVKAAATKTTAARATTTEATSTTEDSTTKQ